MLRLWKKLTLLRRVVDKAMMKERMKRFKMKLHNWLSDFFVRNCHQKIKELVFWNNFNSLVALSQKIKVKKKRKIIRDLISNESRTLAYFENSSTFCTPTTARTADGTPTNEQNIIRQFRMSRTIEKWKLRFHIFMIYLYLDRQQSLLQISRIVYRVPTWWLRSTL